MGTPRDIKDEKPFRYLCPSCRKMANGNTEEESGGEY